MFKIYNPTLKKFSVGGCYVRFTSHGKVWNTLKDLRAHIRLLLLESAEEQIVKYAGCEIYHYEECGVTKIPVRKVIHDCMDRAFVTEKFIEEHKLKQRFDGMLDKITAIERNILLMSKLQS